MAVRFADITGNGRADYLCIRKDGHVTGALQRDDGSWEPIKQIKFASTMDRANLRWADVDGDGKDDLIWIDKFNGDGSVWYNQGRADPEDMAGSSFHWLEAGKQYEGSQAGTCMYYPDFDGDGRADMHGVKGTWTNEAETWYNPPCGLRDSTGDGGPIENPNLPVQPGNPIGGPGPGDEGNEGPGTNPEDPDDCKNLDGRRWRSYGCNVDAVEDTSFGNASWRWESVDGDGAWQSALEFSLCREEMGEPPDSFSNIVRWSIPFGRHTDPGHAVSSWPVERVHADTIVLVRYRTSSTDLPRCGARCGTTRATAAAAERSARRTRGPRANSSSTHSPRFTA